MTELVKKSPHKPLLLDNRYRVVAIDGSDFTPPFNPKSENIIQGDGGKLFCQVHVSALYDVLNKLYLDLSFQPKQAMDERSEAIPLLETLNSQGDDFLVLMGRGYSSFNMFEHCNRLKHCHYVIRTKVKCGGIKEIAALPDEEADLDMCCRITTSNHYYTENHKIENIHLVNHVKRHYKSSFSKNTKDSRWDFETFCNVSFRVCKFRINPPGKKDEWEVLVTNLDRKEFPLSRMKDIYHLRWRIENSFRELKYNLDGIQFHSKKDKFVYMEIYAHFAMYNAASLVSKEVPSVPNKGKYKNKQNFKMICTIWIKIFGSGNISDDCFRTMTVNMQGYPTSIRPGRKGERPLKPKGSVGFPYRLVS